MAKPKSCSSDLLQKELERLYEKFGADAVDAKLRPRPRKRGPVKSGRGAPDIDREYRDLLVLALVEVVKLARDDDNDSWACGWLAKHVQLRGFEMRGNSMWERSWKTRGSWRTIYTKAKKRWSENLTYQMNLIFVYDMLIHWRHDCTEPKKGIRIRGVPTFFDISLSRPDLLIKGIDILQQSVEQARSKK